MPAHRKRPIEYSEGGFRIAVCPKCGPVSLYEPFEYVIEEGPKAGDTMKVWRCRNCGRRALRIRSASRLELQRREFRNRRE
ncbi:MAG TPA: hypothetical protein VGG32_06875 [Thermoplasmata archaeon]|jgi:ribosomal protein L40E